jgi:hypothetical protein
MHIQVQNREDSCTGSKISVRQERHGLQYPTMSVPHLEDLGVPVWSISLLEWVAFLLSRSEFGLIRCHVTVLAVAPAGPLSEFDYRHSIQSHRMDAVELVVSMAEHSVSTCTWLSCAIVWEPR